MRKIVMYCDRCGREFEKWNDKREELIDVVEFVYDDNDPYLDCKKNLCESCYDELEKWWNSKTVTEDADSEILKVRQEGADTKPVKKHRDVRFKLDDKVKTLTETVNGCKLFPAGTIGVIKDIDDSQNLPYTVWSNEFNDWWYYSGDALELIDEEE